jgi:CDP-diacylglycerol--serine O-phosphatidyltransferase
MSPSIGWPDRRRAMVAFPNGLTLGNLACGIYAIIAASRGEFGEAVLAVVAGGVFDAFDGRVARATGTGGRFGEELDSLVDVVTFGLAPGMITYFAVLNRANLDWLLVFFFAACAVLRLARFNVTQAGRSKSYFQGLPSPAAGGTLATYHWFSQTPLYEQTIIGEWPWYNAVRWVMLGLAIMMVSDVPYPAVPTVNFRTVKGILGALFLVGVVLGVIFVPREFFFPAGIAYVLFGALRAAILGVMDRVPTTASVYDGEEEDADSHAAAGLLPEEAATGRRRRRRRRRQAGGQPTPTINRAVEEPRE